ncbi:hypothetical protein D3C83_97670 [compost metagenome]
MVCVLISSCSFRLRAICSSSALSAGMLGAKVASSPMRLPAASASSNIASFGFRTGMASAACAASIAGPNAEQVKRIASAPQLRA